MILIFIGTVDNSAVVKFFADSQLPQFQDMNTYMVNQKTLVKTSAEGIEKVHFIIHDSHSASLIGLSLWLEISSTNKAQIYLTL